MNILVTGAKGFVGRNLVENLKNVKKSKVNTQTSIQIDEIYEYDIDNTFEQLDEYCRKADFVFNFAGVNRPKDPGEYRKGNYGFASHLLDTLKKYNSHATVMLASSIQAMLQGRFGDTEYGRTKKAGEELFFSYAEETGSKVLIYRFPNIVGKWAKPNYNSAVATFCNNIANDLPIVVNDPSVELEMLFVDDLVAEMLDALEGKEHHCEFNDMNAIVKEEGKYCIVPKTYKATLGKIVQLLKVFHDQPETFIMPSMPKDSFEKKLYSMYLTYLPKEKMAVKLKMNCDNRGSFTETVKTLNHGQISVNISKPGIIKGQHWHNSKWEIFIVVSGRGIIQQRKIGTDEILEFEVSGDCMKAVYIIPGYVHKIINLSETENLVTLIWSNEIFEPDNSDTFYEIV